MMLDVISCQISNIFKKKGVKPRKPSDQFQPDYVKNAKRDIGERKKEWDKDIQQDLAEIFEKRNSKVKDLEDKVNGA